MKKTVWYAASGAIARTGPFDTQVRAWASIRLSKAYMAELDTRRPFADNAIVWCEEVEVERAPKKRKELR